MRLALLLLLPLFSCAGPTNNDSDDTAAPDPEVDGDSDGFLVSEGDCDDANGDINPAAVEICDEIDNDCDLAVDEGLDANWYPDLDGDGYGDEAAAVTVACAAPAGSVDNADDCDDTDPAFNPDAVDDCTQPFDYNCDGSVGYADADADTFAACEDCDDTNAAINADAVEACNGYDDNCDKSTDGPDATGQVTWYSDADGDGYGDATAPMDACDAPVGYVADATDCDDTDATVFPGGAGASGSETFAYTGDVQIFEIPGCVTEVTIEAYGAEGEQSYPTDSVPGLGGMARGTLTLSVGESVYVYVGGQDGYNGGGDDWEDATDAPGPANGGGASDVRVGGMDLASRVIVAGGGGGVSGDWSWGDGGAGGGGECGENYCGGQGGVGYAFAGGDGGARGGASGTNYHGGGSGGGGLESGGEGAVADGGEFGAIGGVGTLGVGGAGAGAPDGCCQEYGVAGGGGGYYGGGGVAGMCCGAGGAGGGSSWTGTLTDPSFAGGVQSGHGRVIVSW